MRKVQNLERLFNKTVFRRDLKQIPVIKVQNLIVWPCDDFSDNRKQKSSSSILCWRNEDKGNDDVPDAGRSLPKTNAHFRSTNREGKGNPYRVLVLQNRALYIRHTNNPSRFLYFHMEFLTFFPVRACNVNSKPHGP